MTDWMHLFKIASTKPSERERIARQRRLPMIRRAAERAMERQAEAMAEARELMLEEQG